MATYRDKYLQYLEEMRQQVQARFPPGPDPGPQYGYCYFHGYPRQAKTRLGAFAVCYGCRDNGIP